MVKAVVGDEIQFKLAEERLFQSTSTVEVGLVIGKISSSLDRFFVFDLVPTPLNDAGEPPCSLSKDKDDDKKKRSSSKAKSMSSESTQSLLIDSDWVAEHARQVSQMLLGGINVLGVYIWATESSFKSSTITLWQAVKKVAEAAPNFENNLDEGLLVHISYGPRRLTCRSCLLGSSFTSTSLRPCDFKTGRVLASLQTFRCLYNFKIRLPVFHNYASKGNTLKDILHDGISCHAKELRLAKAIVDGNLVLEDRPCTSDGLHEVELLLPFMTHSPAEACSQEEVIGVVVFSGSICSYAYLNPKETVVQAIADIKADIVMSIRSRLNIICDDGDVDITTSIDGSKETSFEIPTKKPISQLGLHLLRKPCSLPFPRRVVVPWLADAFICDYVQPSDTLEVVNDHCKELMCMEPSTDTLKLLELETEATTLTVEESFWDFVVSNCSTSGSIPDSHVKGEKDVMRHKQGSKGSVTSAPLSTVAAIAILLLAIMVGLVFFFLD